VKKKKKQIKKQKGKEELEIACERSEKHSQENEKRAWSILMKRPRTRKKRNVKREQAS
jgi:hypothetical protein